MDEELPQRNRCTQFSLEELAQILIFLQNPVPIFCDQKKKKKSKIYSLKIRHKSIEYPC